MVYDSNGTMIAITMTGDRIADSFGDTIGRPGDITNINHYNQHQHQ